MRVYWERIGVLGPIDRLARKGFNDREIASKLNLAESKVQGCISWMMHSFKMPNRMEFRCPFEQNRREMAVHRDQPAPAVEEVFWCGAIEARNGPEGKSTSLRFS